MSLDTRYRPESTRLAPIFATCLITALAACGGGGGDSGSSNEPPGPAPSPIPVDPPAEEPRNRSTAEIVVENDDRAADGFVVGNIEDASLADDGRIAVIASADRGDSRAVLRRDLDGTLHTVFDERTAPADVDLSTLSRIRMAPTGEFAFQSGDGLDSDQLHLALGDEVRTIAGTDGAVAPDFRILGNFRIARDGVVAFVGGGGECETDTSGDSVRDLCTMALFLADGDSVRQILHEDFELDRRQANDAQIAMSGDGNVFFSVPGRRTSPVVVGFDGETTNVLLRNNGDVPGFGVLSRVDIVDLDEEGRLLVELGIQPEDPADPVLDHVGLLDGDQLTDFAVEGTVEGDRRLFSLRGIGLGGGRALYEVTLLDETTGEDFACLRLGDADSLVELVCEGAPFPGEELEVFSIGGTRINARGDVLFVTTLGTRTASTTLVAETRATVRRADGELVTLVSSADNDLLGTITRLTTVAFNDVGQALIVAERSRSSDRVLLLGGSR